MIREVVREWNKRSFSGDTLGIIGGNPNGIMLARTAKKMGFTVVVYCSDESNPVLAEADVKWSVS